MRQLLSNCSSLTSCCVLLASAHPVFNIWPTHDVTKQYSFAPHWSAFLSASLLAGRRPEGGPCRYMLFKLLWENSVQSTLPRPVIQRHEGVSHLILFIVRKQQPVETTPRITEAKLLEYISPSWSQPVHKWAAGRLNMNFKEILPA